MSIWILDQCQIIHLTTGLYVHKCTCTNNNKVSALSIYMAWRHTAVSAQLHCLCNSIFTSQTPLLSVGSPGMRGFLITHMYEHNASLFNSFL